jgi:hypothetical protein
MSTERHIAAIPASLTGCARGLTPGGHMAGSRGSRWRWLLGLGLYQCCPEATRAAVPTLYLSAYCPDCF